MMNNKLTRMTPRLHKSQLSLYPSWTPLISSTDKAPDVAMAWSNTSGAAYCRVKHGVRIPELSSLPSGDKILGLSLAKPKSTTLSSAESESSVNKRFSGFRSR